MQDLVKRYFWVLGAVVVMVCSFFAAKATGHILEAKFLGDPAHAPKVAVAAPSPATPAPAKSHHDKDGGQLESRNMFCSDCTPPVATTPTNIDPSSVINTSLPLTLVATNVAPEAKDSYATVIATDTQKQGAFGVGDKLPGATGGITSIHYKYVEFDNSGHRERLVLVGVTPPPAPTTVASTDTPPAGDGDELQTAIDNGIKKIDDNNYEIDKKLVDQVLANPMAVAKGARVVPAVKNGKPDGFKLYAIRPSSVYAKLGLSNGDTIQSINGFELTTADKALEVYTKLREATSLEMDVTRRGKPVTLKYTIR